MINSFHLFSLVLHSLQLFGTCLFTRIQLLIMRDKSLSFFIGNYYFFVIAIRNDKVECHHGQSAWCGSQCRVSVHRHEQQRGRSSRLAHALRIMYPYRQIRRFRFLQVSRGGFLSERTLHAAERALRQVFQLR